MLETHAAYKFYSHLKHTGGSRATNFNLNLLTNLNQITSKYKNFHHTYREKNISLRITMTNSDEGSMRGVKWRSAPSLKERREKKLHYLDQIGQCLPPTVL